MKFLATVLAIFALLSLVLGSNIIPSKDFSNPKYPGKCFINEAVILEPGIHPDPTNKCVSYDCKEDGTATVYVSNPIACQDKPIPPTPPH